MGEGATLGEEVVEMECWGGGVEEEEVWRALLCEAKGEVGLVGGGDIVGGASGEDAFEGADAGGVGVEYEQKERGCGGGRFDGGCLSVFLRRGGVGVWECDGVGFGEGDGEGGADVFFALDGDGSVHGFDEAFGEGEADTGSFDALGFGVETIEGGEDAVHFGFGDSEAGITNGDEDGF